MSNNEGKTYPTHRISFSEKQQDERGRDKLGSPIEVAAVFPRKHGKQGGIIDWKISPEKLGDGAYFVLDYERQHSRQNQERDGFDQSDSQAADRGSERSR